MRRSNRGDLSGQVFGRNRVLARHHRTAQRHWYYRCQDIYDGTEHFVHERDLVPLARSLYLNAKTRAKKKKSETVMKQIGVVAVDSGQLLIVDPCRAVGNWTLTYDEMCEVTLGPDGGGQARKVTNEDGTEDGWKTGIAGVVSGTAYGDDLYPVFQVYEDEQLVGLYVELDGLYYGGPGGPGEMLR